MFFFNRVFQFVLFLLAQFSLLGAESLRTWTSLQGATTEAKFQRLGGGRVHLMTTESKVIQVDLEDLSIADLHYILKESQLSREVFDEVKLTIPEKAFRFNRKTLKVHDGTMDFGDDSYLEFEVLESEHFLIAYRGKFRPSALAEMGERLWHGMASQHVSFRENWGDKKQVVIVTENDESFTALSEYYSQWLSENGTNQESGAEASERVRLLWEKASGASMSLPEDYIESYGTFPVAKVFRIRNGNDSFYQKVFSPFTTNELSALLVSSQMGGRVGTSYGYFTITRGHSFFKEIQLAGRTRTVLLDLTTYAGDNKFTSIRGFEDGRSWAKTLRKLVRKGEVKPDLLKLLSYTSNHLTPEQLVLIYSFGSYMQSDPWRVMAFSDLVQKTRDDRGVPDAVEIAEIFGAESLEEFNKDWAEFVSSSEFK